MGIAYIETFSSRRTGEGDAGSSPEGRGGHSLRSMPSNVLRKGTDLSRGC